MITDVSTFGLFGYIGPGAGLGLLGALVGLLLAVFSALGFIVLWPLRALLRKRRQLAIGREEPRNVRHEAVP
jgi:hypothetical protein